MRVILGVALVFGFMGAQGAAALDCANAQDTVTMTACADVEYKAADAALNAAYQSALQVMQSIDADLPAARRGAVEALRRGQRAWIEMRDGTCDAEGFLWEGGTGQGLAIVSCLIYQTQIRSEVLAQIAQME